MSKFDREVEESGLDVYYDEDALKMFYDECGSLEGFEDVYCGHYEGFDEDEAIGAYLCELYEDMGTLDEFPSNFRYYIDWEALGRDARLGGELYAEHAAGHGYHIFRNY